MKIGLQNAVRTIHIAKRTDMQDFIAAASIGACSGAISNERAPIACQIKDLLACPHRIIGTEQCMKYILWIGDDFGRNL